MQTSRCPSVVAVFPVASASTARAGAVWARADECALRPRPRAMVERTIRPVTAGQAADIDTPRIRDLPLPPRESRFGWSVPPSPTLDWRRAHIIARRARQHYV